MYLEARNKNNTFGSEKSTNQTNKKTVHTGKAKNPFLFSFVQSCQSFDQRDIEKPGEKKIIQALGTQIPEKTIFFCS